ncbi:MAG: TatD family hydrolase [Gammaproteobacteria bacterium]
MLADSHCHLDRLDFAALGGDLDAAIATAHAAGVDYLLSISVDLDSLPGVLAIAERYPHVYASVGVHPAEQVAHEPGVEQLAALSRHPKAVAIGETGLDYFHCKSDTEWQRERFRTHIRAARLAGKPLIVHSRDAREDTLRILAEEGAAGVGGVMHCFTEDWDTARRALDLNFYISFSGIVTFHNAKALREVAARVPLDRTLIETDSPYLAPTPHRGKTNQPAFVRHVAELIATLHNLPVGEVATATTNNFLKLFNIVK